MTEVRQARRYRKGMGLNRETAQRAEALLLVDRTWGRLRYAFQFPDCCVSSIGAGDSR